jgi:S-adenosyl-L-methionine-dependent methyltransferase
MSPLSVNAWVQMINENSAILSRVQFTFENTEDGSPTVRIHGENGLSEAMHSLKGAFSETVYIYGSAVDKAMDKGFTPRVLSMGLGLGYVELLTTGLMLKAKVAHLGGGESFEIIPELRNWFISWVGGKRDQVPTDFAQAYDEILRRTAEYTGQEADVIRLAFGRMLTEGRWVISPALDASTQFSQPFGCICFDAFSSKTTPDLWTEEFLKNFLARAAANGCVLSTYACTGALKRALRDSGFQLDIRMGFSSKRDSTFAVRG